MTYSDKDLKESRETALSEIKSILDDPERLNEASNRQLFGSHDRKQFIVTWKSNYRGMACEERIDITDSFYKSYSGYGAIYCSVGLFHEKQLKGFSTLERALLTIGLKLSRNSKDFFDKYVTPYNERLKATQTA